METALVLSILNVAVTYGIPAVVNAITAINKPMITQEDIDALPGMIKPPEDY